MCIFRVNQAEYVVRILEAASQEYVNTYSTFSPPKPSPLRDTSKSAVVNDSKAILKCIISRKQKACSCTPSTTGAFTSRTLAQVELRGGVRASASVRLEWVREGGGVLSL